MWWCGFGGAAGGVGDRSRGVLSGDVFMYCREMFRAAPAKHNISWLSHQGRRKDGFGGQCMNIMQPQLQSYCSEKCQKKQQVSKKRKFSHRLINGDCMCTGVIYCSMCTSSDCPLCQFYGTSEICCWLNQLFCDQLYQRDIRLNADTSNFVSAIFLIDSCGF